MLFKWPISLQLYCSIFYDGANGVGAKKVKFLKEGLAGSLNIDMYNDEIIGSGKLNHLASIILIVKSRFNSLVFSAVPIL